ncbi:MAG: hypothetical protein COU10_01015, partial [Candidatus Harrisonbacteria bacterium CG10_big_fil_rev_8_21_14_0_10_45_28]
FPSQQAGLGPWALGSKSVPLDSWSAVLPLPVSVHSGAGSFFDIIDEKLDGRRMVLSDTRFVS